MPSLADFTDQQIADEHSRRQIAARAARGRIPWPGGVKVFDQFIRRSDGARFTLDHMGSQCGSKTTGWRDIYPGPQLWLKSEAGEILKFENWQQIVAEFEKV